MNPRIINQLPYETVFSEIGQRGFLELAELESWLTAGSIEGIPFPEIGRPPWGDPKSRYAPSIVCRGEAELLGSRTPRFAIRVYLPSGGFVNTRRLGSFCQQAQNWLTIRWGPRGRKAKNGYRGWQPWSSAARELERSSCVADCLLPVPLRLRDDFHVVTACLTKAFGECCPRLPDRAPDRESDCSLYVRPIATGGGLCAQAVCLMATSLLHPFAKAVHALAEVTAIVTSAEDGRLKLSGLVAVHSLVELGSGK